MADTLDGVGRAPAQGTTGALRTLGMSELGGAQIDTLLPQYAEICRTGRVYGAVQAVAGAVANSTTIPTTTARFVINNISTSTAPKNVVPLLCGAFLGSGTAGIGCTLMAGTTGGALATQLTADGSNITRFQGVGSGQNTSCCWCDVSKTVVANWVPLASRDTSAAAVVGTGIEADCRGMFIVPSTYAFMLHVVAATGTSPLYCFWCIWAELPITVSI